MDFNSPPPWGGCRRSLTEGEDRGRSMQARLLPTWAAVQAPKRAPRAICQECNRAKVSGIYPLAHRLPPPPSPSAPPPPGGGGFRRGGTAKSLILGAFAVGTTPLHRAGMLQGARLAPPGRASTPFIRAGLSSRVRFSVERRAAL